MRTTDPSLAAYDDQKRFNAFDKQAVPSFSPGVQVAFIGNSITHHGPAPSIGWAHDHGMAASTPPADYVHRVLSHLGLGPQQAAIGNFAELEREPIGQGQTRERLEKLIGSRPALTIIQLGDNVNSTEQLQHLCDNLCELLPRIKTCSHQTLMLSTWWESPQKDAVTRKLCELFGARYIHIGDLFLSPENRDRQQRSYAHDGVDTHPQDWGMAQIASRVLAGIDTGLLNLQG